ncbi:hypothetical protein HY025_06135 [Candidatus Daviesbacteria bacterium]|nr:hypothetical protein [Candidatus Daviesbacteria bacterium]
MALENQIFGITNPQLIGFELTTVGLVLKIGFIAFAIIYFIFTLIVVRQVNLMTETFTTELAGFLKALSIFYALVALAIVILFFGFL